jgi:HK97 family phage major capsid protein
MSKKENRNDPTAEDGDVMDALQQLDADIDKAIAAQKTDPDRKTDPDDAAVSTALSQIKSDVQNAIMAQSKDGAADARARMLVREVRSASGAPNVRVKSEPRMYTENGEFSYFRDLASRSLGFVSAQTRQDANARLLRHAQEIVVDYEERNEYVVRAVNAQHRNEQGETRAVSTASTSDGVFVTPQYLIEKWITYRSPDRSFTNQCTILPLPAYGITFNIPSFTNYGSAARQVTENTGVQGNVPTGSDVEVTLQTFAGAIPVSQQLLDRGGFQGQGGSFDVIVIQQSQSQLWAAVDQYLLTQALAGAFVINQTATATVAQFYVDLATARNNLADTAGVKLPGTHVFSSSDFLGYITSQVDADQRPILLPDAAALVAVNEDPAWAGFSGIYLPASLRWFADDNIPNATPPNNETTILVGSPKNMLVWIGDMIPFTAQQTNASELSVVCGLRQYAAGVARHAQAFAYITGTGYPTSLV